MGHLPIDSASGGEPTTKKKLSHVLASMYKSFTPSFPLISKQNDLSILCSLAGLAKICCLQLVNVDRRPSTVDID